jgi:hypothetical protein
MAAASFYHFRLFQASHTGPFIHYVQITPRRSKLGLFVNAGKTLKLWARERHHVSTLPRAVSTKLPDRLPASTIG